MNVGIVAIVMIAAVGCTAESAFELGPAEVQRFVDERCAAVETCCDAMSRSECEQAETAILRDLEARVDNPLTFSEDCFEQIVSEASAAECTDDVDFCRLAHGNGQHGDACTFTGSSFYWVDSCADGLQCLADRCVDNPLVTVQPGGLDDLCSVFEGCDVDLFCNDELRCAPKKPLGEPCTQFNECEGGNRVFCEVSEADGTGVCRTGRPRGEACSEGFECAVECDDDGNACSKLACFEGQCQSYDTPAVCVPAP